MLTRGGFRHGVHPEERKELTNARPIRRMPFPDEVILPRQSDLLAGKDTLHEAALAWVRAHLKEAQ